MIVEKVSKWKKYDILMGKTFRLMKRMGDLQRKETFIMQPDGSVKTKVFYKVKPD